MSANTYPKSTSELLDLHGHLVCPKTGKSYKTIFNEGPGGKLKSNWLYFDLRIPLIKIDSGEDRTRRSSRTPMVKVLCEHLSRDAWMKLWDDTHTNPYEKVVQAFRKQCLDEMNATE